MKFERLAVGNDLEGDSRSSELPVFDRLFLICSYNDSIWHHFQDVTTCTVYVTGCDLEKSFVFKNKLKLQAMHAFRFICKHIIDNTCCISQGM